MVVCIIGLESISYEAIDRLGVESFVGLPLRAGSKSAESGVSFLLSF